MGAALNPRWAYRVSALVLLTAVLLLTGLRKPGGSERAAVNLQRLPLRLGGWEGREIPLSERDRQILGTGNVIFRQYRKGAHAVNLYLLESGANRALFHPPEYCYVGAKAEMVKSELKEIRWDEKRLAARMFLFRDARGKSLVYYWYTCGEEVLTNYYRQQFMLVNDLLRGRVRPSFLIRVSAEGEFEEKQGEAMIEEFVREVFPALTGAIQGN